VLTRVREGRVVLDLRTLGDEDMEKLALALKASLD